MINRKGDVQAFFDELADGWSDRYCDDPEMALRLMRFSEALIGRVSPRGAVLDFGCGAGVIARWLAEQGYTMSGCDISIEMVNTARSFASNISIHYVACAGGALPYPDSRFAAVVCSSVMEYVDDLDATLDELHRVLAPGGWLLVTVPDSRHPHRRKEALWRAMLRVPLLGHWLARSPWAEGAAYLRLSRNRMRPANWVRRLQARGFQAEAPGHCEGPLLLLAARRREQSA